MGDRILTMTSLDNVSGKSVHPMTQTRRAGADRELGLCWVYSVILMALNLIWHHFIGTEIALQTH